jgi:hypothetical protein
MKDKLITEKEKILNWIESQQLQWCLFGAPNFDNADISVEFLAEEGFAGTLAFRQDKFANKYHFANYIRVILRRLYEEKRIRCRAKCMLSPYGVEIQVTRDNASFKNILINQSQEA